MFGSKDNKKKNKKAPYAYLRFVQNLSDRDLSSIPYHDLGDLEAQITDAITRQDYKNADLYAKKMALYYGVPGLLYLHELSLISIKQQIENGETAETDAFNALTHLFLAQIIYEKDPLAKEIIRNNKLILKGVDRGVEFWREKVSELTRIYPNLRRHIMDAKRSAVNMYQDGEGRRETSGKIPPKK